MEKFKQKILIALAVLIVGAGGLWLLVLRDNDKVVPNTENNQAASQPVTALTISEDQRTVSYDGQDNKTALEILKSLATVTTEQSSVGEFVTGINGVTAEASQEYWSFYVNGVYASEGASTYSTTSADKIEWKLEQIQ